MTNKRNHVVLKAVVWWKPLLQLLKSRVCVEHRIWQIPETIKLPNGLVARSVLHLVFLHVHQVEYWQLEPEAQTFRINCWVCGSQDRILFSISFFSTKRSRENTGYVFPSKIIEKQQNVVVNQLQTRISCHFLLCISKSYSQGISLSLELLRTNVVDNNIVCKQR